MLLLYSRQSPRGHRNPSASKGDGIYRRKTANLARPFSCSILLLCTALLLGGCTTGLPNYAAPKISVLNNEDVDRSDVITYRKLSRTDFKGTEPPPPFDERMAAVTCVYTQPVVDKNAIDIQPVTTPAGHQAYDVTFRNLSYQALMNRKCSWWNPNNASKVEDYVLEHEQIHFALFEIAAREWSELPALSLRAKADSIDGLKREIQAQFENLLQQRLEVLTEQNRQFDEETSLGHNPEKQREWLDLVRSKLPSGSGVAPALPQANCQISDAASASMARARAELNAAADQAAMLRLIEEAESATRAPECDSVRARILADKAYQLIIEPSQ